MATGKGFNERELYAQIGRHIRNAREKATWTQSDLAEAIGLSRTSVTNIERGRQPILVHTLYVVALALNIPVSQFLPKLNSPITDLNTLAEQVPDDTMHHERKWIETLVNKPKRRK